MLRNIWLRENPCIDIDFEEPFATATMSQVIDENCGYSSHEETSHNNQDILLRIEKAETANSKNFLAEQQKLALKLQENLLQISGKEAVIEKIEANLKTVTDELYRIKTNAVARIVQLQAELDASMKIKASCEKQNAALKAFSTQLEIQRNQTCAATMKQLRDDLKTSRQKNEDLVRELQKNDLLVQKLTKENKRLEKMIELLATSHF